MINCNITYYNKENMNKDLIKEIGIKMGATRADIKGKNIIFVFNVATTDDMQEQDCISFTHKQAFDILKNAGFTINSINTDNFDSNNTTNIVKLTCKANEDINKEYNDMEKKVMNDSINDIRHKLRNPWLSQETKDDLQEKLYNLQQEQKAKKKAKDSVPATARQGISFVRGKDGDSIDVYFDGDYVGYGSNHSAIFVPASDCPNEIVDYFLGQEWTVKTNKGVTDAQPVNRDLTIHEKAALVFSLAWDMGFYFDDMSDAYEDAVDKDMAFYEDLKHREASNDEEFFDDTIESFSMEEGLTDEELAEHVQRYDNFEQTKVQDDGVYKETSTGKGKFYANAREEREALAGAHRYHTPYPYSGNKEYDEKFFSIENFPEILSVYFMSNPKNMPHNKDIPAPSYEAVIGEVLGVERLEQLLKNVEENTKYEEKKFYAKNPNLRYEASFDPKIVRDYLTAADLVKMLRPEEKAKVINYLRFPPHPLTKEQQKAYEMVHPKTEVEQISQDISRAKAQSEKIRENSDTEIVRLIKNFIKTGRGDYQKEIETLLGRARFDEVLKADATFIPQIHFDMLTPEEQTKVLKHFKDIVEPKQVQDAGADDDYYAKANKLAEDIIKAYVEFADHYMDRENRDKYKEAFNKIVNENGKVNIRVALDLYDLKDPALKDAYENLRYMFRRED